MLKTILMSIVLLIPCFWQPRIEAGDLGSHVYNAWLAQQIGQGKMPGLQVVPMTSNVLFDLILTYAAADCRSDVGPDFLLGSVPLHQEISGISRPA